ncbi:MAG: efflux RND transporter periplasmic adaptor subunit [Nitrospirae bacterium]|nr:efflux RND transporter periplasmic adaptor subunit [Nitrospirota bacterium]
MRKKTFFTDYCSPFTVHCLLFTVYCLLFLPSCSKDAAKQAMMKPAAPVTIAPVIQKTVPVQLRAIGTVEAYSTVSIKARVSGELLSVNFKEGQDVKKGDLLFTIDPRPYETALAAVNANLAKDSALAQKAADDFIRYAGLFKEQLVSREDYERVRANAEALKAAAAADRAAVDNAKLQLGYCSIYSPVTGRTGSLLADPGSIIKANDDKPMVVINQIQPVFTGFSVPEQNLPDIRKRMASGKLKVEAFISNEDKNPAVGTLNFIDNTVDAATGTIKLKAIFPNKEKRLWPGQFVNAVLTLDTRRDAIVAPSQAVQTGQQGQFVFVVKGDSAELRPVNTGITHEDMTVIEKGLAMGEQVVTDGQMRLMPGAKVEIKNK